MIRAIKSSFIDEEVEVIIRYIRAKAAISPKDPKRWERKGVGEMMAEIREIRARRAIGELRGERETTSLF